MKWSLPILERLDVPKNLSAICDSGRCARAGADARRLVPAFTDMLNSRTIERAARPMAEGMASRAFGGEVMVVGIAKRALVEGCRLWPGTQSGMFPELRAAGLARRQFGTTPQHYRYSRIPKLLR